MQRIFTLVSCLFFIAIQSLAQTLSCPGGGGTSAPYVLGGQTFTTAAWGTSNGDFTYSDANDNYQAATASGATATITSPFFTIPGAVFTVGAQIAPGNRIQDYTISIVENNTVIACFDGTALSTGGAVGIAASFSGLAGRTVQIRFTFPRHSPKPRAHG
jgi:hypothetical protein